MGRFLVRTMLLFIFALSGPATAHSGSNSYVYWTSGSDRGRLDVSVADVDSWLLPAQSASWASIRESATRLEQLIGNGLTLTDASGSACALQVSLAGMSKYGDDTFLSFALQSGCATPQMLDYQLFFAQDPTHRALVTLQGDTQTLRVLSPVQTGLSLRNRSQTWGTFLQFGWQGMLHFWFGYDHVLFLLTLMLAVVAGGHKRMRRPHHYLVETIAVVTAFTIAHSITLFLAATGTVQFPISLVEVVIALSITFAAIQVRWQIVPMRPWVLAFAFGLIHGFGFANVLADLIPQGNIPWLALVGFNIGLELAQVAVAILCVPLLLLLVKYKVWQRVVQPGAVITVAAIGLWWAYQRMPAAI